MSLARKMARARNGKTKPTNGTPPSPADQYGQPNIVLQNPVAHHFPQFIFGNALAWEQAALKELGRINPAALDEYAREAAQRPITERSFLFRQIMEREGGDMLMAKDDAGIGQTLVLCGAGPSLNETAADNVPKGDQVWGCNSAVTWLLDHGYKATHGFTVDQTAEMLVEWRTMPDVEYLVATTVHPHLTELLAARERKFRFFHNFCGIANRRPVLRADGTAVSYEFWLYETLFPSTALTGAGLNSVNRALDLALFMQFQKIIILGADCAMRFRTPAPVGAMPNSPDYIRWLREEVTMHADGGHALASNATALTLNGTICPHCECPKDAKPSDPFCAHCGDLRSGPRCDCPEKRTWLSKPDMIVSSAFLAKYRNLHPDQIELVGDTMPVAMQGKSDRYLRRLPTMVDGEGKELPFV